MGKLNSNKTTVIGVRLTEVERDQLAKRAEEIGMSISQLVRKTVIDALATEEILNAGGDNIAPGSYLPLVSQNEFLALLEKHNKLAQVSRESALAADREIEDLKQRVRVLEEKG